MSTTGDRLTQVARLVMDQGHARTDEQLAVAVAVCMAESGGNPQARCYNYWDAVRGRYTCSSTPRADAVSVDRGLWQINSKWHPEVTDAQAFDPVKATVAAYRISSGFTVWKQWATYNAGAHTKWLTAAKAAITEVRAKNEHYDDTHGLNGVLNAGGNAVAGATAGVNAVASFLGQLANGHTWVRVVQVVAGLGAIVVGALLITGDQIIRPALGQVAGQAKGAATGAVATRVAAAVL